MSRKILKQEQEDIPPVSCFLIKVASRCNLDCDYCYVYQHADQSWKDMPKFLGQYEIKTFISRLSDYISEKSLKKILVILHGGEPILFGMKRIIDLSNSIRAGVSNCEVDISLQTNGVLLTDEACQLFEVNNISVSLSLDGPKEIHNLHRPFRTGKDSFYEVSRALELLQKYPTIFTGVISVIDPRFPASRYFEYFDKYDIPSLDFLLPDANYLKPAPYIKNSPDLYVNWLIDAFSTWFNQYPHISVRTFESLILSLTGDEKTGTDAFGFGDVSLLCIETDGSYHDLDVLKVTKEGQSNLGYNVSNLSIIKVLQSEKIKLHRKLLSKKGMSKKCLECDVLNVCGGGAVPHRFSGDFDNPSIYCNELYALISHAKKTLTKVIQNEHDDNGTIKLKDLDLEVNSYCLRIDKNKSFYQLLHKYKAYSSRKLLVTLDELRANDFLTEEAYSLVVSLNKNDFESFSIKPAIKFYHVIANSYLSGVKRKNLVGSEIDIDWDKISSYVSNKFISNSFPQINVSDNWLRLPFEGVVEFQSDSSNKFKNLMLDAFEIIKEYDRELYNEILHLSPSIQFIHDTTASPDKAVSFSDNTVPGCLYIGCECSGEMISRNLAAESIIHEHLHQKLHMLQNFIDLFIQNYPYVESPWREELRPPSGLLHAIFVFVEVFSFWCYLFKNGKIPPKELTSANNALKEVFQQLNIGFDTLKKTNLSSKGMELQKTLIEKFEKDSEYCQIHF
ncbi:MAG: FxsB family radical SAM/SPASM domain protein [Methylococcaceae bacterium]|nr:FxsB family radical SAM/SPASM domain protein [Methylococcaceae bacterium]